MLKKGRVITAAVCFVLISLIFCDFTGTFSVRFAPLAKIQLIPAILAGSALTIVTLAAAAILLGRLYCSTVCPLGIFQDLVSHITSWRKKNRSDPCRGKTAWRVGFLTLFIAFGAFGYGSAAILDPYGAFGRMASHFLAPIYRAGNNLLAFFAERAGSFIFYETDVWMKGGVTLVVATVTFVFVTFFAWRFGRLYCNTVCPVGTVLGFLARFAIVRPRIDTAKCNGYGLCAKNCKASCIDPMKHTVDMTRCVVCFDCLEKCPQRAFSYSLPLTRISSRKGDRSEEMPADEGGQGAVQKSVMASKNESVSVERLLRGFGVEFSGGVARIPFPFRPFGMDWDGDG